MFAMAKSRMIPKSFAKLHPRYKTPVVALSLLGITSIIAPLFGRVMLVWIVDAANFACCLAYCLVAMSFVVLRKKESNDVETLQGRSWSLCRLYGNIDVWYYGCNVSHTGYGLYFGVARMDYSRMLDFTRNIFGTKKQTCKW